MPHDFISEIILEAFPSGEMPPFVYYTLFMPILPLLQPMRFIFRLAADTDRFLEEDGTLPLSCGYILRLFFPP